MTPWIAAYQAPLSMGFSRQKYWSEVLLPSPFPGGISGQKLACQSRRCKSRGFDPWVGKILWKRKWQPTAVFLPGESHGWRSLVGYSPWVGVTKSWTRLSDFTFTFFHFHTIVNLIVYSEALTFPNSYPIVFFINFPLC